ncbi:hypothetical protein LTR85_003257 [Meristemomyces frigidus]|nr:hypothetical protein LTR85_003257 [Meristemomyces frigidus]
MEGQHKPTFAIVALPKLPESPEADDRAIALAHKFRELRLQSLRLAPEAFASSYEVESQRGIDQTLQRLSNPKAVIFLAVSSGSAVSGHDASEVSHQQLVDADWVGFAGLLGPETEQSSSSVTGRGDPWARATAVAGTATPAGPTSTSPEVLASPVNTLHYHIGGVYVSPSARGSGLGHAMIAAALARADAEAQRANTSMSCSVLVKPENVAARGLYEKAGFAVVGEETYVQQARALVAGESQPEEMVALRMELDRGVTQT